MAYKKRKTTTRRRKATMKRRRRTTRKTPQGRAASAKSMALKTDYARAVLDPKRGPLVGVPQFVPIDTHRARVRLMATDIQSNNGYLELLFNPIRMVASDAGALIKCNRRTSQWTSAAGDVYDPGILDDATTTPYSSNAQHAYADFQCSNATSDAIDNPDGVRARIVGCVLTVTNTTSADNADGVFTCLHERHHKTLERFTVNQIAQQSNAIVKRCGSGTSVSLLYRPVKPEEVENWQRSAFKLIGEITADQGSSNATAQAGDGTLIDAFPGYMRIAWDGTGTQKFMAEAHAIVEYVGEGVTTLAKPIGGRRPAMPSDVPKIGNHAATVEQNEGTIIDPERLRATLDQYAVHAANEQAATTRALGSTAGRDAAGITSAHVETMALEVGEAIGTHVDARIIEAAGKIGQLPSSGHPDFPVQNEAGIYEVNSHLKNTAPKYLKDELQDIYAVQGSNGGRHVTFVNEATGEVTVVASGTRFSLPGEAAGDVVTNWSSIAGGAPKSEFVGSLETDILNAKELAYRTAVEHGTVPKPVRLLGHSQGGSTVAEVMKNTTEEGMTAAVFNPGVGVRGEALADIKGLTVYRTHTDPVSLMDHLHDSSLFKKTGNPHSASDASEPLLARAKEEMRAAKRALKVQNFGMKATKGGYRNVVSSGHRLNQWHFTDAEVNTSSKFTKFGQVGVKRLPRIATIGKAAGPVVGALFTGMEIHSDLKNEHTKRDKAAVTAADSALAAAEYFGIGAAALAGGLPLALAAGAADMLIHGTAKKYAQKATKATAKFIDRGLKKAEHKAKAEARVMWRGFKSLFKHKRRPKRNPYKPPPDDIIGHKRGRGARGRRVKPRVDRGEFSD